MNFITIGKYVTNNKVNIMIILNKNSLAVKSVPIRSNMRSKWLHVYVTV